MCNDFITIDDDVRNSLFLFNYLLKNSKLGSVHVILSNSLNIFFFGISITDYGP